MGVHNLADRASFTTSVENAGKGELVVLDCFATWCGPCKVIAPLVEQMSKDFASARFYKIDVDEAPDVAQELGIRAMPTFILFKDGEKVDEIVGADARKLRNAIQSNI